MRPAGLSKLRSAVRGAVITPDDADYAAKARMYSAAVRSKPAVLVYCTSAEDVGVALAWARERSLAMAVRSGGCSVAGFSTNVGGVVIDVSRLNRIDIDPTARTARIGAGVQLGQLYERLSKHDLVVPGGECPMVGISGLTLGGGISLLGRSLGFTVDSLVGAEVVLASGETVNASPDSHPDLFWALRGGGGSFGVVTELRFRLSPLPPQIPVGMLTWPADRAVAALTAWLDYFHADAPDALDAVLVLATLPGGPGLAAVVAYAGAPAEAELPLQRLRAMVPAAQVDLRTLSYSEFLETHFHAPRHRDYELWKSGFVADRLPTDAIEHLVMRATEPLAEGGPSAECMVSFELCGGAMNRVGRRETAFVHRDQRFLLGIFANSAKSADRPHDAAWAHGLYQDLRPHFSGQHYQNYPDLELADFRSAYYGENYDRLLAIKRRYDPDDVFSFAQSIGHGVETRRVTTRPTARRAEPRRPRERRIDRE